MKITNIRRIARTILNAVKTAEELYSGIPRSGKDKKKFVVDILNDRIDIPLLGEKTEAKFFGLVVDIVVEVWKEQTEWLS